MTTKVMLDSGAFSSWALGGRIKIDDYIDYIRRNEHLLHCYINLDVIPGSDRQREWRRDHIDKAAEASYRNQQRMKEAGLSPIPVFHQDEDFDWLQRYCRDGESYIALAPSKRLAHRCIPWVDDCFALISDFPRVRVHGLGTTSPLIAHRYKWASLDSGTWFRQPAAALIPIPLYRNDKHDYSLSPDIVSVGHQPRGKHVDALDEYDLASVHRFLNELGIELAQARSDYLYRWKIWICYFKALAASAQIDIYFVSAICRKMRETLAACDVRHHLLSYHYLRNKLDGKLQNYIVAGADDREKSSTSFHR